MTAKITAISTSTAPFSNPVQEPSFCSYALQKIKRVVTYPFGYLLRICVFMLGEIKTFGARAIIRFYNFCSSDPHPEGFDAERVNRSKKILEALGGVERVLKTPDGLAEIRYMLLTYDNFKRIVESHGGTIQDVHVGFERDQGTYCTHSNSEEKLHLRVLIPPSSPTSDWKEFESSLDKMNWPRKVMGSPNGKQEVYILSDTPAESSSCILNVHTARRSYAMDRKYISQHLGSGFSVCGYDPRGTHESTGTATEGGHYLDAKTVLEALHHTHGFPIDKIWATGSCGGGPIVAFLKKEFHERGINIVLQNTYTSLEATIRNQPFPASWIGWYGMNWLKSEDPEITSLVEQDSFNSLQKLQSLAPYKGEHGGTSIVLYSTRDTTLAPEEGSRLSAAAEKIGKTYTMVRDTPQGEDGHIHNPLEEPAIWNKYVQIIR